MTTFEDNNIISEEQPVKKSRKGLIIGIIAGLIAIIAIVAVLFFNGTLMPAKMMLGKAVNKGKGEFLDQYKQGYEVIQKTSKDVNGDGKISMKVSIGEQTKQVLASTGVDLSWFDSAQINVDTDVQKEQFGVKIAGSINDTSITSADVVLDSNSEKAYVSCPDIFGDKAIVTDTGIQGQLLSKSLEKYSNTYSQLADKYPTPEVMEKIVTKYSDVLVQDLKDADVKKSKKEVKAGDVSAKYYQLEIALDTKTVDQVTLDIIDVIEKDKDTKNVFENALKDQFEYGAYSFMYDSFDDFWADMIKNLGETKTKLKTELDAVKKNPEKNEDMGTLYVYIDNSMETKGMHLDIKNLSTKDYSFEYLITEDGNNSGLLINGKKDGKNSFVMEGQGEDKSDIFSGQYKVSVNDKDVCTLAVEDFELTPYEKSKGKVKIKLDSFATDSFKGSPMEAFTLADYVITFDTKSNNAKMDLDVKSGDASLLTLNIAYSFEKIEDMSVPTNVVDPNNLSDEEAYNAIKSLNLTSVLGNLEKAGVPEIYYKKYKYLSDALATGDDMEIANALHNIHGGSDGWDGAEPLDEYGEDNPDDLESTKRVLKAAADMPFDDFAELYRMTEGHENATDEEIREVQEMLKNL